MGYSREAPLASHECTLALARNGYHYIGAQCARLGNDLFQSRLLFKKTIFLRGEEAAKLFYDTNFFTRQDAAPKRLQKTLFGVGGIQGLEGTAHHQRKALFLSIMSQSRIDWLAELVEQHWQSRLRHWETQAPVVLLDELHFILCRAAVEWCGIPLQDENFTELTKKLVLMIEGAAAIGTKHWASRRARLTAENNLISLIDDYRRRPETTDQTLPFAIFANLRSVNGTLLPSRIAAVELLNILRPIVAVARYIVFSVQAMHEYPSCYDKLRSEGSATFKRHFIQEVRRYYPFFPFLAARVKKDFTWHGYQFHQGWQAILDIHGTNHDPNRWDSPGEFRPERFEKESEDYHRFAMIPQGGSDHETHHRCPGEWITLRLMDLAIDKFVWQLDYRIPPQNLGLDFKSIPTHPRSKLIIDNIRRIKSSSHI
ncbi:cytochrome P450 [Chromohalobacter canadensis]|uniref:cytochrome P450 n=1 Tax=Chromohalobacter canadensis TaxID=141389 RepID=UPI002410A9E6|nr:cytochrome P450 [Chromohalobacter canadensis]